MSAGLEGRENTDQHTGYGQTSPDPGSQFYCQNFYENFFLSFGYVGVQNWQFKPICPGDCSWIHTEIETKNNH